ncbi:type III secretion system chaperone [Verrucomicrobium spinosum]|uniref:type III secretion system chaperone n=1 Tax=Verrucomicrobium spinosum TaxID=2736 RepID=UPI003CCDF903
MEANFLRRGTREAVLGLAEGKPVLLRTLKPGQFTYPEFRQVVEDFVNTADTWSAANAASDMPSANPPAHDTAHYLCA